MSAKEVKFGVDARDKMLRGVDILNNAVKVAGGVAVIRAIDQDAAYAAFAHLAKGDFLLAGGFGHRP